MGRPLLAALLIAASVCLPGCGEDAVVVTEDGDAAPAPAWLHVTLTSPTAIAIRWSDVTADEVGFIVQRSLSRDGGFQEHDQTPAGVASYTDDDVVANERYYYRVLSYNALGQRSRISAVAFGDAVENQTPTTPASPSPRDATEDLPISGPLTLSWTGTDPDGGTVFFDVYFGESSGSLAAEALALSAASHTLSETPALTRSYYWRVVASDAHGATALSPIWFFGTQIERVAVPGGYVFMGDCGRLSAEGGRFCMGQHQVNGSNPVLVEDFLIDKYEVSNQRFAQFLNRFMESKLIRVSSGRVYSIVYDTLYAEVYPEGDKDSGIEFVSAAGDSGLFVPRAGRENHPVVEVSWFGAARFAKQFRLELPSEAQWEKAARGTSAELGDTTFQLGEASPVTVGLGYPYPWGGGREAADPRRFNHWRSGDPFESPVSVATTPAGFFDGQTHSGYATRSNASPYGVLDMAGNAAEWCRDAFYPYDMGTYGGMRVVKGGGWRSQAEECQTFWRQEGLPESTDNMIGFRTVRSQ